CDVFKGQPAEKAGLKRGDIITSVNNKEILNSNQLRNVIASLHPGEKASIEIIRQQKRIVINVRIRSNDHKSHHSSQKYEKPSPENKKEDISTKLGIKA